MSSATMPLRQYLLSNPCTGPLFIDVLAFSSNFPSRLKVSTTLRVDVIGGCLSLSTPEQILFAFSGQVVSVLLQIFAHTRAIEPILSFAVTSCFNEYQDRIVSISFC